MPKLIDKIKPEVLRALDRHVKLEYPTSHRMMIASLEDVERYRDLTIEQVFQFVTFLPTEFKPKGEIDVFHGDHLLQEKYKV
jgi:hypothetical protein